VARIAMQLEPTDAEQTDLAAIAGHLGERLVEAGVAATPERRGRFAAAVHLARPVHLQELYWLGRVTLITEPAQIPIWDQLFAQVFGGLADVAEWRGDAAGAEPDRRHERRPPPGRRTEEYGPGGAWHPGARPRASSGESTGEASRSQPLPVAASAEERLRSMDFAHLTEDELGEVRALMGRLAIVAPHRPSRRQAASRRGAAVDMRATLARAHRTDGEPVVLRRRHRRSRPRRLVFLCDVSGSMEAYSRTYLQLLLSAVGGAEAEAFVFSTRLTRLTRSLRMADADLALREAGRVAPDWSGGTRIGDAIKAFIDGYGRAGMARGAVIVIISDGWERGDSSALGAQMGRLRRLAHRIVWVNPRSAGDRFQPLTGGMAAALPHVDRFVSGHSLGALDEVLAAISGRDALRPG
jgi:uncharacterized protein with von Willebrand factor type A (vWA) domain